MTEFFTQYSEEADLSIHYCGQEKCEPDHFWGPAIREHILLSYIINGKGKYQTNNKIYYLNKHTSFFILPGQISFYKADHEEPWEYIWIGFSGLIAKRYLELMNIIPDQPILYHKSSKIVEELLFQIYDSMKQRSYSSDIYCLGLLRILFAEFIRDSGEIRNSTCNVYDTNKHIVEKAISFININYSRNISIQSIAEHIGFERSYFSKIFKEKIHETPHEYLLRTRIERASRLLCYTDIPIEQVAYSVGFDNPLYFSKVFKKYRNVPPSVYRMKNG